MLYTWDPSDSSYKNRNRSRPEPCITAAANHRPVSWLGRGRGRGIAPVSAELVLNQRLDVPLRSRWLNCHRQQCQARASESATFFLCVPAVMF